jgi:hypothetical protein
MIETISAKAFQQMQQKAPISKYKSKRVEIDGITFASKREGERALDRAATSGAQRGNFKSAKAGSLSAQRERYTSL